MNKRFLLALVVSCAVSHASHGMMQYMDNSSAYAKVGAGLLALATLKVGSDYIFKSKIAHDVCKTIKFSPIATRQIALLSTSALTLSFLTRSDKEISGALVNFAWKAPLMGLANFILKKPAVRNLISQTPIVGEYLACPLSTQEQTDHVKADMDNKGINNTHIQQCEGSCEHDSAIDAIRLITGWLILDYTVIKPFQARYFSH